MNQILSVICFLLLQTCLFCVSSQEVAELRVEDGNSDIYTFSMSKDDKLLYYATGNKFIIYSLWDRVELKSIEIQLASPVTSICVEDVCNNVFLGTKSGKLVCYSIDLGRLLFETDHKSGSINALALTSDNRFLLCGCENGMVYKHSVTDTNVADVLFQHYGAVTSIEISPAKQLIAIASGDGTISLFSDQTFEVYERLFVKNEWVRKVAFNDFKGQLLSLGDGGKLYEWKITDDKKARLNSGQRVSSNWLLSLDIGAEGQIECWGGLDHLLQVRTQFGTYKQKLNGPVLQTNFVEQNSSDIIIACLILGKGIYMVPVKYMKFKSIFN